jgi:hypothetical protein
MKQTRRAPGSGPPGSHREPMPTANSPDLPADLAYLRRRWGEAYRITWDSSRFRATHIISAEALDAKNATALQKLILRHHTTQAASRCTRASGYR